MTSARLMHQLSACAARMLLAVVFATTAGVIAERRTAVAAQAPAASPDRHAAVALRAAAIRDQCFRSAADGALAATRRREDDLQRTWCDATRAERRTEFAAAFVESVRRARHGGDGAAKTLAAFLRDHPEAIKADSLKAAVCQDDALRIDQDLIAPVINRPSVTRQIFGVTLNGTRVSRLDPVTPWHRLVQDGIVLRSGQMAFTVPLPVIAPGERTAAVSAAQEARCPSTAAVENAISSSRTDPDRPLDVPPPPEARDLAAAILESATLRQQLNPMMQLGPVPRNISAMSDDCRADLSALLTYDELGRRLAREIPRLVSMAALRNVAAAAGPFNRVDWFQPDDQLRTLNPQTDPTHARIVAVYGDDNGAAFIADSAAVSVAATQGLSLALEGWSLARSVLLDRCVRATR